MATNLQFVFYRNKAKSYSGEGLALRGRGYAFPIKSDVEPYYHWNDFKACVWRKLKEYKN